MVLDTNNQFLGIGILSVIPDRFNFQSAYYFLRVFIDLVEIQTTKINSEVHYIEETLIGFVPLRTFIQLKTILLGHPEVAKLQSDSVRFGIRA